LARNSFNQPLLLSVAAAAFTLVAMGGLFLGPSIVECSPDDQNIAGDDIASCLLVDLNERLPLAEALAPLIDENLASPPDVQTEIIEPVPQKLVPPESEPQEVVPQTAPQEVSPQEASLGEILSDEVVLEISPDVQAVPDNRLEEMAIIEPQNDEAPVIEQIIIQEIAIPEIMTPADVVQKTTNQEIAAQETEQQKPAEQEPVELEPEQPEIVRQEFVRQELVRQIVALAPTPAPMRSKSIILPTVDAVEIDGELNFIAGAGEEGFKIRLFVDNELTGTSIVAGGRWLVEAQNILDASSSRIRADMVDPVSNELLARAQVNFELEIPEDNNDLVELETPQGAPALLMQELAVQQPPAQDLPAQELPLPFQPQNSNPAVELPLDGPDVNVEIARVVESAPSIMSIDIAPPANIFTQPDNIPSETAVPEIEQPELASPETVLPETLLPEITAIATEPVEQLKPETAFSDISPVPEQIFVAEDVVVEEKTNVEDDVTKITGAESISPDQIIVEKQTVRPDELAAIVVASTTAQVTELAINDANLPATGIDIPSLPAPPEFEQTLLAQVDEPIPVDDGSILDPAETEPVLLAQERSNAAPLRAVIVGDPDEMRFASGKVIIRNGDNLWSIASRVYGMGQRYVEIYEANIDQISNPHWIYPGQVFELPDF